MDFYHLMILFFCIFAKNQKYYEQESTMGHDASDECLQR